MITIPRQSDDFNRQVWQFEIVNPTASNNVYLYLRGYYIESRRTKRHKWVIASRYGGYDRRTNDIKDHTYIPIPDDVQREAIEAISITVTKIYPR